MSIPRDHLYELLPALYRERDAASGGALREYLRLLTDQLAIVADGIDQLHDDLFVETAAPWVLPYLADLIGLRGLPGREAAGLTSRAEVANTIAYRTRKGTAAVLEQVARDTTGWPARAVEFFELLATTQHVNHARPGNHSTVGMRSATQLAWLGDAFERGRAADLVHLPEMRRAATRGGRYGIPNVGLFLWRLRACPVSDVTARPAAPGDPHRFLLDPLGAPVQLFTKPVAESDLTRLAEPVNLPMPLTRWAMDADLASCYGAGLSVHVHGVVRELVEVCDLSDVAPGGPWAHTPVPGGRVRLDPALGRVAFGDKQAQAPTVSYHRGFGADLGGGEYERVGSFAVTDPPALVSVRASGGADHTTIAGALAALPAGGGVVEIRDNARYSEALSLTAHSVTVELRAADRFRPTVELRADLDVTVSGGGAVVLNGLLLAGGAVRVAGDGSLGVRHCTLVPGIALDAAGAPVRPGEPSLHVDTGETSVAVERSILGGVRCHVDAEAAFRDCVVDAGGAGVAHAAPGGAATGGGRVAYDACTVLGRVHARILDRLSNSIVLADDGAGRPVLADRRQRGCVRFSSVPPGSRTPRRHRCVPEDVRLRPVLESARYGDPAYCRLDRRTPDAVWRGADDRSELGVYHHLRQPLREAYLRARLDDYLRFGLEVGLVYAT
ncbi:hypothetical protein AB0D34_06515 [Streptomyces sp. NPDC048420]|uniref:hypothetical protein n=1 Tax=Streptomyces sp. NPDC048420 TaxID=3155755 RepID=UPI003441020C